MSDSKIVVINSANRISGTSSDFRIPLPRDIFANAPRSFNVKCVTLPFKFYNVTDDNNTLVIREISPLTFTRITIPNGVYKTTQDIVDAFNTAFAAASLLYTYNMTYNTTTDRVSIEVVGIAPGPTNQATIQWIETNAAYDPQPKAYTLLGFNPYIRYDLDNLVTIATGTLAPLEIDYDRINVKSNNLVSGIDNGVINISNITNNQIILTEKFPGGRGVLTINIPPGNYNDPNDLRLALQSVLRKPNLITPADNRYEVEFALTTNIEDGDPNTSFYRFRIRLGLGNGELPFSLDFGLTTSPGNSLSFPNEEIDSTFIPGIANTNLINSNMLNVFPIIIKELPIYTIPNNKFSILYSQDLSLPASPVIEVETERDYTCDILLNRIQGYINTLLPPNPDPSANPTIRVKQKQCQFTFDSVFVIDDSNRRFSVSGYFNGAFVTQVGLLDLNQYTKHELVNEFNSKLSQLGPQISRNIKIEESSTNFNEYNITVAAGNIVINSGFNDTFTLFQPILSGTNYILDSGTLITIPPGTYSPISLSNVITTQMNNVAIDKYTYNVNYNYISNLFQFRSTAAANFPPLTSGRFDLNLPLAFANHVGFTAGLQSGSSSYLSNTTTHLESTINLEVAGNVLGPLLGFNNSSYINVIDSISSDVKSLIQGFHLNLQNVEFEGDPNTIANAIGFNRSVGYYFINDNNSTFNVNDSSGNHRVRVPNGEYKWSDLAEEITEQLNLSSSLTYNVFFEPLQEHKWIFESSGPFSINFNINDSNTLGKTLGFNNANYSSTANKIIADNIISVLSYKGITPVNEPIEVISTERYDLRPNKPDETIASVPIDESFGLTRTTVYINTPNIEIDSSNFVATYKNKNTPEQPIIDLRLENDNEDNIDLQNQNWSTELIFNF